MCFFYLNAFFNKIIDFTIKNPKIKLVIINKVATKIFKERISVFFTYNSIILVKVVNPKLKDQKVKLNGLLIIEKNSFIKIIKWNKAYPIKHRISTFISPIFKDKHAAQAIAGGAIIMPNVGLYSSGKSSFFNLFMIIDSKDNHEKKPMPRKK